MGRAALFNRLCQSETGFTLPQLTPKHFSFNSHLGACPACQGLGSEAFIDPDLVVPHKERSLSEGAVMPWAKAAKRMQQYYVGVLESVSQAYKVSPRTPWEELPEVFRNAVLFGTGDRTIEMHWGEDSRRSTVTKPFEGVVAQLQQLYETTESELSRQRIRQYMSRRTCSVCQGARLRPEILAVTIDGVGIHEFSRKPVSEARMFIESLRLTGQQDVITTEIRREIGNRLNFLCEVGLGYLTLDRESGTLSGGEAQRIRLATQIGSGLAGCLYVLDEPSIGLHQRDNDQLIGTLRRLRKPGNSVIVVEHDEDTIRAADHILDLGPGAGVRGGYIVAQGSVGEICQHESSLTGQYLAGRVKIPVPKSRKRPQWIAPETRKARHNDGWLTLLGANENNLKQLDVSFPLGCLTCVTGVSGSGKSTLVDDILRRALFRHFYRSKEKPGKYDRILGLEQVDKVIVIDQTPIGRTPRSNPATFTGAFGPVRDLYSNLPASRVRGYDSGRFSFNVKGGRCEACEGDGVKKIEMHFLADVYVGCEVCRGRRYNRKRSRSLIRVKTSPTSSI
jgi:excinuclease ABC subunit A